MFRVGRSSKDDGDWFSFETSKILKSFFALRFEICLLLLQLLLSLFLSLLALLSSPAAVVRLWVQGSCCSSLSLRDER